MPRKYNYRGKEYTVKQLSQKSGIYHTVLYSRLKKGWTIEEAVETPAEMLPTNLEERWQGKELDILFKEPIPNVYPWMQPTIDKIYHAVPAEVKAQNSGSKRARYYHIIRLENGGPLIVYPNEFEILGIHQAAVDT